MDAGSIERLELKNAEKVTGAHVMQLDRAIARNAGMPGVRVRRRVWPWGTSHSFSASGGVGSSPIFQPDVTIGKDVAQVRWGGPRALIGGVAPTIDVGGAPVEIFTEDAKSGQRPALLVRPTDFSPDTGECRIYFRVTVGSDFRALKVEPVALFVKPVAVPKMGFKLALFLRMRDGQMSYDEDADREMFCGQGFIAVNQRPSGKFESLWWATF